MIYLSVHQEVPSLCQFFPFIHIENISDFMIASDSLRWFGKDTKFSMITPFALHVKIWYISPKIVYNDEK